jgi:O-antigen/teichoic acid export membrane protein
LTKEEIMAKEELTGLSKGLKALFIIHGVFSILTGFLLLLAPFKWAELSQYGPIDQGPMRLLGAIVLALGFKDWFCFRAKGWGEVRIIVIQEVAITVLATLACLYVVFLGGAPKAVWMNLVIFAALAVAWIYFYVKYRK